METKQYIKYINNIWKLYFGKYTRILMFVSLAKDDKYKFAKAAETKNYLSVLFEETRTETWIYN